MKPQYLTFHNIIGDIRNEEYDKDYENEHNEVTENNDGYKYPSVKCTDKCKKVWYKIKSLIQEIDDDDADYGSNNYLKVENKSDNDLHLNDYFCMIC